MNQSALRIFAVLAFTLAACSDKSAAPPGMAFDFATGSPHDMAAGGGGGGDGGGGGGDAATAPSGDMATVVTGSCGTCPAGYTCGSANGQAVCRSAAGIPLFTHVFIIMMENTSWATLKNDDPNNTKFTHGLIGTAAHAADYHGVTHPSLPNYLALTSGSPGVQMDGTTAVSCDCDPTGSDCNNCNVLSSCNCEQMSMHLGDQIEAATKSWRAYGVGMGTACNTMKGGNYVPRHVPFLYYQNVQSNATRCSTHVVDYSMFAGDLASVQAPQFFFIAPDLVGDMHGTSVIPNPFNHPAEMKGGDDWLAANVPAITNSDLYKKGGILFIAWDEDDLSGGLTGSDDPIPLFVLSPYAKSGGFESTVTANHYALLATIEDGLNLGRIGSSVGATPLSDYFPAN